MREFTLKEIENHKGYFASSDGRLFLEGFQQFRFTKGVVHKDKMRRVIMDRDNPSSKEIEHGVSSIVVNLAYLIAETFVDNPNNYHYITFLDKDRNNCSSDNLKWLSNEEWEREQPYYKGELLYGIEGFNDYYITESRKIYSDKGLEFSEVTYINKSRTRVALMSNESEQIYKSVDEFWELRVPVTHIEEISTERNDDYDVLMADEKDLMIKHIKSGKVFDTIKQAAFEIGDYEQIVENHVYRITEEKEYKFILRENNG